MWRRLLLLRKSGYMCLMKVSHHRSTCAVDCGIISSSRCGHAVSHDDKACCFAKHKEDRAHRMMSTMPSILQSLHNRDCSADSTRAGGAQVGTGYFDAVSTVVTAGASSTLALTGSTENAQFH